ncbi:hypothetical protein GCM10027048_32780 [Hymenobacter coalescens]
MCLTALTALGQQPAGWQIGLRPSLTIAGGEVRDGLGGSAASYRQLAADKFFPALLVQRHWATGYFGRASLSQVSLPAALSIETRRGDTLLSTGLGFVAGGTLLRLEMGRTRPLGASGRTRLLSAVGLGLLYASAPSQRFSTPADTSLRPPSYARYWGASSQTLERRRRFNGLLSTRVGLVRELPWRDVVSLELALHYGLAPVYRTRQEVEFRGPNGPEPLGATTETRGSFVELGVGYHWQAQKKKLISTPYLPPEKPRREPWQPLPTRGLYLTGGMRMGAALARQGRSGHRPTSTIADVSFPVFNARLGYQWPAGWLVEAGPQTAYVLLFGHFDPQAAAPASLGPANQSSYVLAPQHGTELTGWPLNTAWALMSGRRWTLRPDRWYATAKGGVVVHRYTGPVAFGDVYSLMSSTPTEDYSEFSFAYSITRRWRVLAQLEGELEARIGRRTLLGLQLAYAARFVGRRAADQAVISWYYNGQAQPPVEVYSRMTSLTAGLQLRRVLHL